MGNNVVIIAYQFSVVVKSMEKGLVDQKFNVTLMEDKVDEISAVVESTDVFLLYLPDSLFDDQKRLKNLFLVCDTLRDSDRKMILIGTDRNRESFMKVVPALREYTWMDRPVDMKQLIHEIEKEAKLVEDAKAMKKILIIDDDESYARMVAQWLKDVYRTEIVTDGMRTIAYLTNHKVDLILLDYEMPVLDGPKVLEMLRKHSDTASIPVMFLTGVGTRESIARVMEFKPQGYILKTATREQLMSNLKSFFVKL